MWPDTLQPSHDRLTNSAKWYYAATEADWALICERGYILDRQNGAPRTLLHSSKDNLDSAVILAIDYEPMIGCDDYEIGKKEIIVYEPLPLWLISRVK